MNLFVVKKSFAIAQFVITRREALATLGKTSLALFLSRFNFSRHRDGR